MSNIWICVNVSHMEPHVLRNVLLPSVHSRTQFYGTQIKNGGEGKSLFKKLNRGKTTEGGKKSV